MDAVAQFQTAPPAEHVTRKGPLPRCDVYGIGNLDLFRVLHTRRQQGETWPEVQRVLDGILGVAKPIKNDHFRYHWSGKCGHWDGIEIPDDHR